MSNNELKKNLLLELRLSHIRIHVKFFLLALKFSHTRFQVKKDFQKTVFLALKLSHIQLLADFELSHTQVKKNFTYS